MEWLSAILRLVGIGRNGTSTAIDGYDRLTQRLEKRLDAAESRLDDCDQDRAELHKRADDCDEDRQELRREVADLKDKVETLEEKTNGQ